MNLTLNNIYPKTGYKSYTNGAKKHTKTSKIHTNVIQIVYKFTQVIFLKKGCFLARF